MTSEMLSEYWEGLIIQKDKIVRRYWVNPKYKDEDSDEIIKEGYYAVEDVSHILPRVLTRKCIIENNVTLRDFFKILEPHKSILSEIFYADWFGSWLEYGLAAPMTKIDTDDDLEIDHFEIAYLVQQEDDESNAYYSFDMVSKPLSREYVEKSHGNYSESSIGESINIGFLGSDISTLMDYPLKLSHNIFYTKTYRDEDDKLQYGHEVLKNYYDFRLFDIISAIFFELSFYGSPDNFHKRSVELVNIIENE